MAGGRRSDRYLSSSRVSPSVARTWIERWERQQRRYALHREQRTQLVVDLVVSALRHLPRSTVLDLGSGPGTLSAAIAARLPGADVVAVDADAFLIEVGRAAHPGIRFAQTVIGSPGWQNQVAVTRADVIVSSTALHYPRPAELSTIYRDCADLLRPGGMLLNADHLVVDDPVVARIISSDQHTAAPDDETAVEEDWASWWRAAAQEPDLDRAWAPGEHRGPVLDGDNGLSDMAHAHLLRTSGFAHTAIIWRRGISAVQLSVR